MKQYLMGGACLIAAGLLATGVASMQIVQLCGLIATIIHFFGNAFERFAVFFDVHESSGLSVSFNPLSGIRVLHLRATIDATLSVSFACVFGHLWPP